MRRLPARLASAWRKNAGEILSLLDGSLPRFAARRAPPGLGGELPVFVFHEIEPERFEVQLRHLEDNGYRTVDAETLARLVANPGEIDRHVALTFDDARSTFWSYGFPLLERHGLKGILFVVPGLVPEGRATRPNLGDVWAGRRAASEVAPRRSEPLCGWGELRRMHESGAVDVQSHSFTHARVAVASRIVDFLHPGFDTDVYGNVNVPLSRRDDEARPDRALRLGAPVFESASRLAGRPRFIESEEVLRLLEDHVRGRGGAGFFSRRGFRRELFAVCRRLPPERLGSFETVPQMEQALRRELRESKLQIEAELPGQRVRHFCYPWFEGARLTDGLAAEEGYTTVHYGLRLPETPARAAGAAQQAAVPLRVRRISEEYLLRLPGRGRISFLSVWTRRLRGLHGGGGATG